MNDLLTGHRERLSEGAVLLRGYAIPWGETLLEEVERIASAAPFRHMVTRGGHAMSVAMTNCGQLGWVSDRSGYRYSAVDPGTGEPWPVMPGRFAAMATGAATEGGFPAFVPNACLVNRYSPGTRMGLHQDRDEPDLGAPIVSVSLGLSATFLWGGSRRADPASRVALAHGDVLVFGGPSRLAFHGIATLKPGDHPLTGPLRLNLTFRKAS